MHIIGLMSGTSLDGIDAVLVQFIDDTPKLIAQYYLAFPADLRETLLQLQSPIENELHLSHLVANTLSKLYAESVNKLLEESGYKASLITAIGCHGQTIRHRPECGYTIQLINAALLAELTHITVASNFRSRDIAAGGQGAPLVPAFHTKMFAHATISRAIVNIGGVSNLTYLSARQKIVRGFDCGPGNILMDFWINKHLKQAYDHDGEWALQGRCIPALLNSLLQEPFFQLPPPKSTGRDLFHSQWLYSHLQPYQNNKKEDIQATLLALTTHSIARSIENYSDIEEVYLCGGGANNKALLVELKKLLPQCKIGTTYELGIKPEAVEALAFAWLTYQTLNKKPSNLPSVTGAQGGRILGDITFA